MVRYSDKIENTIPNFSPLMMLFGDTNNRAIGELRFELIFLT